MPDNKEEAKASSGKEESPAEDLDFYFNEDGNLVFTAHFHRKRGYCCENGCLHCPYRKDEL